MEQLERIVIELDQRTKSNGHRLDRLEDTTAAVHELATSVKLMAQTLERMATEQEEQGKRLGKLEQQPAERWNNMTRTIFTSVLSTLAGGLVGALVTMLIK